VKTTPKILLVVVGVLIAAGVVKWFYGGQDDVRQIPFDSTAWQRATPIANHRTLRSQMIQDLVRRYKFEGWTRQQLVALLGEPTSVKPANTAFAQWDAIYILGLERAGAWSLDDEALGFKFDTADRVTKYGLSTN
jgi:hypothetical protein